jgi:predicted nucleic acid-binding protein
LSTFVVDASVAIKWVVAEPGTKEALALLGSRLFAPALLQAECANILWKKVRRGELSAAEAGLAARLLANFGIEFLSPDPEMARVLELAMALDHPAYDCVYLAAAEKLGASLVTADERLVRAVRSAAASSPVLKGIAVVPLLNEPAVN